MSDAKKKRRWGRRLIRIGGVLVVGLIVLYCAAPSGLGWFIGHKLKGELATRINAKLDFRRVIYQFPYGVRVENAHLLMPSGGNGPDASINVGRLELTLAKLPIGSGPLLIKKLEIEHPVVRLASNFSTSPAPSPGKAPAAPVTSAEPTKKLSDLFQLQNVKITNGQFEYDFSTPGKAVPPVVWGHLDANMNTLATSGSTYNFNVAVQDDPLAIAKLAGSFDIDLLQLNLDKINVVIACEPAQSPQQIPPQGLAIIQQLQIGGQLVIDGTAKIPLQTPELGDYTAHLSINKGHCQPPGWSGAISPTECTLNSTSQAGNCKFDVVMKDRQISSLSGSGSFDFKTLILDVNQLAITTQFDPGQISNQVPARLADAMHTLRAGGQLTFNSSARLPVTSPLRGVYVARVDLKGGQCQPPGWTGPVTPAKLSIVSSNIPGASPQSLPQSVPSAASLELPAEPLPVKLWVMGMSASSGNQLLSVDRGEVVFNSRDKTWVVQKFRGTADIGDGPGPLDGADSRIILPFYAAGEGKLGNDLSGVRILIEDGSAVLTKNHLHINRINGMLTATPERLSTTNIVGVCADGQLRAKLDLFYKPSQLQDGVSLVYASEINITKLDLHQLAMQYSTDPAIRQKAFGSLDSHTQLHGLILKNSPPKGTGSVADQLVATGDLDITDGYFLNIPVLRDILVAMQMGNASTVGEAAATYDIANQVINFSRVGASSPAVGIQGSGTLGFDMQANMIFVGTPLANWSKDAKGTGLINEAGAAIVGKVQDVVNGMQRAIYQFRVTGNVSDPKVDPVVIPFLSDKMAPMFQKMAGNQNKGSVAEELKKQQSDNGGK